jgi:hypothetical protein
VNSPVAAAPSLSPTSTRKPTQLNDKLSTLKRKISPFKMEVQQLHELSAPSSALSFPSNSIPTVIDESKSVVADETKEEFKIEKEKDVNNVWFLNYPVFMCVLRIMIIVVFVLDYALPCLCSLFLVLVFVRIPPSVLRLEHCLTFVVSEFCIVEQFLEIREIRQENSEQS